MIGSGAMVAFRFRQFKVYHDAKKFRKLCLKLVDKLKLQHAYDLADQIKRASLSVVLNIAEGSSKRSDIDFARFLETSSGSVNEVVAAFDLANDEDLISHNEYLQIEKETNQILDAGCIEKFVFHQRMVVMQIKSEKLIQFPKDERPGQGLEGERKKQYGLRKNWV